MLGWSAGAVPALAVAARHPALVTTVGIVAGLPPVAAYDAPGLLDAATDDRRAVAELAREMDPAAVGELLGPLTAPWPCDLDLAREHVLEGADALRRAELDAVPGAVDAMAAGVVDAVAQGLAGLQHDIALQVTPPDIELGDVVCPVRLWYGAAGPRRPAVVRPLARGPPAGGAARRARRRRALLRAGPLGRGARRARGVSRRRPGEVDRAPARSVVDW